MMTSGLVGLIFVRADETSVVLAGTNSGGITVKPRAWARATAAVVEVFENPSSAEMNAMVVGFGVTSSLIASTMLVAYRVAGDSTANVRLYPLVKMASSAPELSTMTCLFRSTMAAAALVAPEPYGPRMSLRPWSLNWSISCPATSDFDV